MVAGRKRWCKLMKCRRSKSAVQSNADLGDSSQRRNDLLCRWFPGHIFSSILVLPRGLPRSLRRDSRNRHNTFPCNHSMYQNSKLSCSICKREADSSILANNRFLPLSSAIVLKSRREPLGNKVNSYRLGPGTGIHRLEAQDRDLQLTSSLLP